jgi:hypothetical protein
MRRELTSRTGTAAAASLASFVPSALPGASESLDDGLSFNPWHGLAEHRPLGSVNRVRRAAYESSATFRGERNGCPMHR